MNNNSSKQILLSVIGVAILVVAVVGVSFAFFSYVYNSEKTNTVETGTIIFSASDTGLELTNVFPTAVGHTDFEKNSETATVSISGHTTYENGIDFTIRAVNVTNTNGTIVPTVTVTPKNVEGVTFAEGYTDAKEYNSTAAFADGVISKGTIAEGTNLSSLTEILDIEVYYDMADYHISENTKQELVDAGLLQDSYAGTIIAPSVWNVLSNDGPAYSFTIQVTAVEGGSADPRN